MLLIRFLLIGFSILLVISAGTVLATRSDSFEEEWATVQNWVDNGGGLQPELALFHPATGYQRPIKDSGDGHYVHSLHWSPDGTWLIVTKGDSGGGALEAFRVHWSGIRTESIETNYGYFPIWSAVWSPNDEWGVVVRDQVEYHDILLVAANGHIITTLIDNQPWRGQPLVEWSPDSETIYISICETEQFDTTIYRVQRDPVEVDILMSRQRLVTQLEVSNDGEWLAVDGLPYGDPFTKEINRIRTDGTEFESLVALNNSTVREMWWAEDNHILALINSVPDGGWIGRIDLMLPSSNSVTRPIVPLVEGIDFPVEIAWTLDHGRLVTQALSSEPPQIVVMNEDGSDVWKFPVDLQCSWYEPNWILYDLWVVFTLKTIDDHCGAQIIQPGDQSTSQLSDVLPFEVSVDQYSVKHQKWMPIWYRNTSFRALQNQETGAIVDLPNSAQVIAWSKCPTRTENIQVAFGLGLTSILVTGIFFPLACLRR